MKHAAMMVTAVIKDTAIKAFVSHADSMAWAAKRAQIAALALYVLRIYVENAFERMNNAQQTQIVALIFVTMAYAIAVRMNVIAQAMITVKAIIAMEESVNLIKKI